MKFIETLRDGERVGDIYLCKQKTSAVTKNGKAYESLILQDKTGTIDAKIWDPNSQGIDDFEALDYVDIVGDVTSFNGMLQISVKRARKVSEGEYEPGNYLPVSQYDIEEMYQELIRYIESIKDKDYQALLHSFFTDDKEFSECFKKHSAAKSVHHGFIGGLLEHSLSVAKVCDFFAGNYPVLNRDLLLTAAMLHDIGKTKELSFFPINDYTDEGNLLGHIVIGTEMVSDKIREIGDFPVVKANQLKHCIIAHHGELEFGSPKKPAIIEAVALSFADNLDAKVETFKEALESNTEDTYRWQGYNRLLETNIRKTMG